jgi:TorA maturation chaperone TorD
MSSDQNLQVLLVARTGTYRIFQNIFGNEPDENTLVSLIGQSSREILSLFVLDENSSYADALQAFFELAESALEREKPTSVQISNCFTRLFVGPGFAEAEPWESVYSTKEHALFQPITLEVRKAYVAQGFIPQSYPHVADDHIALELDFMAELAAKLADAFAGDDIAATRKVLTTSEEFLSQHLLRFVPSFVATLMQAKHNYFYKEAGVLLGEFLKVDAGALEEIKSCFLAPGLSLPST